MYAPLSSTCQIACTCVYVLKKPANNSCLIKRSYIETLTTALEGLTEPEWCFKSEPVAHGFHPPPKRCQSEQPYTVWSGVIIQALRSGTYWGLLNGGEDTSGFHNVVCTSLAPFDVGGVPPERRGEREGETGHRTWLTGPVHLNETGEALTHGTRWWRGQRCGVSRLRPSPHHGNVRGWSHTWTCRPWVGGGGGMKGWNAKKSATVQTCGSPNLATRAQ